MLRIVRPSPEQIKAKRREIAQRYARKHKRTPITFAAIRVSELTKLFDHRYNGLALPDSDDGVQMVRVMVHHLARLRDAPRRIGQWCMRFAPWLGLRSVEVLINEATEHPLRWKADRIAWKLRVTAAERVKLGLRTIGATDQTREQRLEISKARKREQQQAKRRMSGAKPRQQYEQASAEKAKPWLSVGMSRATWYRKHRETGV